MERCFERKSGSGLRVVVDRRADGDPDREDDGGREQNEKDASPAVHGM
jgi:hypothetical protein